MTRETKIGLLVGLSFIIVIGILVSDHLTSSTEPPMATLAQVGPNVHASVTSPGARAPITERVTPPEIQPTHVVPTRRDTTPPTPAREIITIGPGTTAQPSAPAAGNSTQSEAPVAFVRDQPQPPANTNRTQPQPPASEQQVFGADPPNTALSQVAQQYGEPLVTNTPDRTTQAGQAGQAGAADGFKEYVAQPGDSLSKIAARFFGTSTAASRDAIVKANPSLLNDPNKVIYANKPYRIPASIAAAPAPAVAPAPTVTPAAPAGNAAASRERPGSTIEYWYTVKTGDSLWKIANEQLGKGGAGVAAIKELNKDVLNGSDIVQPEMKLRLPGKPLAQAN